MSLFVGAAGIDGMSRASLRMEGVYVVWRESSGAGWCRGSREMAVPMERRPLNRSVGTCEIEESWLDATMMSGDY